MNIMPGSTGQDSNFLQLLGYPLLLVGALELFLAVTLLRENKRNSSVNKSVSAFSFFAAAYAFITGLMYVLASFGHDITFLARANWISWMMIPAGLQFIFFLRDEQSRKARFIGYILYPFWFLVFCISISTSLIEQAPYSLLPHIDLSGPLDKPLRFVGVVLIFWFMYEIYKLRRQVTGIKRSQLNYFFYGLLIFAGGGVLLAGILHLFDGFGLEPGLGSYFSLPWVVLTFYAITRYRLFDIRSMISRMLSIVLLTGIFSGIQIGFFRIFEPLAGFPWTLFISLLFIGFVFFGSPFTRVAQRWVRNLVHQNRPDYRQIMKESSRALMSILDLQELLAYLVRTTKTSLQVQDVHLFLRGRDGQYVHHRDAGDKRESADSVLDGSVVEWIKRRGQVVIREELERNLSEEEFGFVNAAMKKARAEVFMPLMAKGSLLGVLMLEKKENLDAYDKSDLDLLDALAGPAATAVENAQLYEKSRRMQESLFESQERFRNLVETTSDWVWEMNDRGVYTYVSPKIREILGYEPEEMLGKTFFDFMPREEARRAADFFVSLTRHQKPFLVYQNTCLHKSGRIVIIETSGVPVFDKTGSFAGYRGIDRDVTKRNELEGRLRYSQKMEAIGRVAAGVAHDFNNINMAIIGHASLLHLDMKKDDRRIENVDQILKATERAAKLTQSLLAFGRKQATNPRPVNLNTIVTSIEKLMTGMMPPDINFVLDRVGADLIIDADPIEIERIIMNLVSNARDAMPGGGQVTIETRVAKITDEFIAAHGFGKLGLYALMQIADTGTGIDQELQKKIFEPFFTTKGVGKGTGLGLSIVYDIVKQQQGYVTVTSMPGRGTTFSVYLPLLTNTPSEPLPETGAIACETVLVADNDDEDRQLIKAALEAAGCTVLEAVDGEETVEKFRNSRQKIHALVLDVIMPKMSGKETYRQIREMQPDIKVLFTSSYTEDVMFQKGMLDSSMNFILKPFSPREFLNRFKAVSAERIPEAVRHDDSQ